EVALWKSLTMPVSAIVVMGVSGCGKSTVGELLAERLGCDFLEGDSLHPVCNIAKMSSGVPLTDQDRLPWLLALHAKIQEHLALGKRLVVSCSALKPVYRYVLRHGYVPPASLWGLKDTLPAPAAASNTSPPKGTYKERANGNDMLVVPPGHAPGPAPGSAAGSVDHDIAARATSIAFVLLDPSPDVLRSRLQERERAGGHFMKASLLDSQLAALSYTEEELFAHIRGGCTGDGDNCLHGGVDGDDGGGRIAGRGGANGDNRNGNGGNGEDSFPDPQTIVTYLTQRL
ncbi:hypothetical protein Vretifemale_6217, partial [Volvox reticuliferus]